MLFASTWMDLEIIILSQTEKRQISYVITYMWNLKKKKDTKELIYKNETDSQTLKTNLWLRKRKSGWRGIY